LIDITDDVDASVPQPTNNHNTLEELNNFNGDSRLGQDQDLLVMLSDDKPALNEYIENTADAAVSACFWFKILPHSPYPIPGCPLLPHTRSKLRQV
jgi:hypothetical protein